MFAPAGALTLFCAPKIVQTVWSFASTVCICVDARQSSLALFACAWRRLQRAHEPTIGAWRAFHPAQPSVRCTGRL